MPFWLEATIRIIGAIFSLVVVLFLAYVVLNWMNKRVPGLQGNVGSRKLIEVLDRVQAGRGGNILLIRVQDKVFLVAVNEHAVEKLYEFDDPDKKIKLPDDPVTGDFASILKDTISKTGFSFKNESKAKSKTNPASSKKIEETNAQEENETNNHEGEEV